MSNASPANFINEAKTVAMAKDDPRIAEAVLNKLDEEREKFTQSDKELMQHYVDILVEAGIYPSVEGRNTTHMQMVESYGARWHIFRQPYFCPHCKADLREQGKPPFKREISVEDPNIYDGTCYFQCPDCDGKWSRRGTPLTKESLSQLNSETVHML